MRKNQTARTVLAAVLLFAVLAALLLTGCGGTTVKETAGDDVKETESKTETAVADATETEKESETEVKTTGVSKMRRFEISYYWGPQGKLMTDEKIIREIAECGFTSIPIESQESEADIKTALTLMKKYGLTCSALTDSRVSSFISPKLNKEAAEKLFEKVLKDYKDFDNIEGWWLMDEPNSGKFSSLANAVDIIRRLDPDRTAFIDLFPNYATNDQLAASSYSDYVNTYIERVNPSYLCYDHYHFTTDGTSRKGNFSNLETIRKAALDNDLQAMQIVLLTKHGPYDDLTRTQIKWEVAMDLAYGMKRICYFTYAEPTSDRTYTWSGACRDRKGNLTEHYYDVQAVNAWAKPIGDELFNKTSTAVFHTDGNLETGCKKYKSYGALGEIDAKSFVIGFFDDESFMIVNKAYRGSKTSVLTASELKEGLEFFDPADSTWKSADNCPEIAKNADGFYEISFLPGDALLLRVNK